MKKKSFIFISLVIISIFCMLFLKLNALNKDFSTFNNELWEQYPNMRYKMIVDFEQKYPINVLTKSYVKSLLGDRNLSETENMYSYYIGSNTILGSYYALIFDESGCCISRSIYND